METEYFTIFHLPDVSEAAAEMKELFPSDVACPVQDFGSNGKGEFPCSPGLDQISLHPMLLAKARELLGTKHIRLVQSIAWAKYGVPSNGEQSNSDQRMHMDYGNNCYGMPLPGEPLQAVSMIVYFSDTEMTGGGTAVVPRRGVMDPVYQWPYVHMPGIAGIPFKNDRKSAEKLMDPVARKIRQSCYARELRPKFSKGDVLMYRLNTWHRGTPVLPGQVRYTLNLVFKRADNEDIQVWNRGFTQKMYSGRLERFIGSLEPEQLETLGFPARDSAKWRCTKFCEAIRVRYGWTGFDLQTYVLMPESPGPVPAYWPFSNFTMTGATGAILRAELFAKLSEENVHISLRASDWRYRLEFVEGVHYLTIDCRFFQRESDAIVDMNLLSGDRWTWGRLVNRLKSSAPCTSTRFPDVPKTTPAYVRKALSDKEYSDDLIFLMGQDLPEEHFLPFLGSTDTNVARIAASRLTRAHKCDGFDFWCSRKPRNFLERKIWEHIQELGVSKARL